MFLICYYIFFLFLFQAEEGDQFLTIPSFVLRGAGKQTHYEYEIRINLPDGRLNILRRYSRFRELHLSMKHCYGAKVCKNNDKKI